ncbi:glycosyltransferase [Caulobacter endophyticus]|uniref:rhamnosyltransferase WsaF family glycosyltransferase n=1 Tax=Caulobacter endophyticus TaxID=2172652 RepID=UPI00240EE8DA|nr:glycosyltransferase [Caulobacter endophyticus]MDG2528795.1 glycosyltransferase [Caulobacter endophyticus]
MSGKFRQLTTRLKERRWVKVIEGSGEFDRDYYIQEYKDVASAGLDPIRHYIRHGASEGRDPSRFFNTRYYLHHNPDVAGSGLNPLVHFISFGRAEGRVATDMGVQIRYIVDSGLLDRQFYLQRYPDVAAAGLDPAFHYLSSGYREGRDPGPLFDTAGYLQAHPEVMRLGLNPLLHFLARGGDHGSLAGQADAQMRLVATSGLFDYAYYIRNNPDVAATGGDPLQHYLTKGWTEGRNPSAAFGTRRYQARYLQGEPGINPLIHYLLIGRNSGYEAPAPGAHERERWTAIPQAQWARSFEVRLAERLRALKTEDYGALESGAKPVFSLITTVYDTPPEFIEALADTIQAQAFRNFEWLILDNGSHKPEVQECCRAVAARDKRFKLFRVEDNLHIIGGNRFVFEKAKGRYTVPIDSDDLLYPDSLAHFAKVLLRNPGDEPVMMYSDEHKVDKDGEPVELIWRWGYAFSHAMATAPAAHLMAFQTARAREVGAYTDDYARGSHDWDTALRLTELGGRVVHIPEVLYGWRIHAQSTAGSAAAKDYISSSQFAVMEESLKRRGMLEQFEPGLLFGSAGWYEMKRREIGGLKLSADFVLTSRGDLENLVHNLEVTDVLDLKRRILCPSALKDEVAALAAERKATVKTYGSEAKLSGLLSEAPASVLGKAIISSGGRIASARGLWDALGALELDTQAGVICGPVVDREDIVFSLGLMAGLNHFVGSPFYEWRKREVPGHLWMVPRPVTATPLLFVVVRASLLRDGLAIPGLDHTEALHGLRLSLESDARGYGTVYIPGLEIVIDAMLPEMVGAGSSAKSKLRREFGAKLGAAVISSHLSTVGGRFGKLRSAADVRPSDSVDYKPFSPAVPLSVVVRPELSDQPMINVLLPAVRMASMSGGPNTVLNLAYRLAKVGFGIRIIATDIPLIDDLDQVWEHIQSISGVNQRLAHVEIVDGTDRSRPFGIGAKDIFFATAWWTAQMAKHASALVGRPFIYMVQDFEPILYPASSHYAMALETYDVEHIPVINTQLLRDFLTDNDIGRYRDPAFAARAISFEPSLDRTVFHPQDAKREKRRLLFYARPTTGARNLFEVGVAALQQALATGDLSAQNWEFIGMGEAFTPVRLGHGGMLECAPWLGFDAYAEQMRKSDILLSLMMSPHPSYPPLEMAACGGVVVTNTYANKSADRMAEISSNILAVEPSIDGVAAALAKAVDLLEDVEGRRAAAAAVQLPGTWDEALDPVVKALVERLAEHDVVPVQTEARRLSMPNLAHDGTSYSLYLNAAMNARRRLYPATQEPGLLSFVTTVWNTPPAFIDVLARSVDAQEGGTNFEWYILDNGTTRPDVIEYLKALAKKRPYIRLERVEENLGIIGGMRHCLERATGRYILPLDSDDYLTPDCVRIMTWHLQQHGYPALAYSDEDKLQGSSLSGPYLKPDWDPVLFVNSCYIAHLCAIDREKALALGAYGDSATEGSHDWDTFTRFMVAGHEPVHVPEVLYSWRMHAQSTASNIDSKPVVYDSQRAVLERFLAGHPKRANFQLAKSPLFGSTPDWWLRRNRTRTPGLTSIVVTRHGKPRDFDMKVHSAVDHEVVHVPFDDGVEVLLAPLKAAAAAGRLVHIVSDEVAPDNDEWFYDAVAQFELFPDTVIVGGRTHSHGEIFAAGYFFGFGEACDCPDRGRSLLDPGYSAQLWKQHSVSAVSMIHAVAKPEFMLRALAEVAAWTPSMPMLGSWLGAYARKQGERVVYSPFICAETFIDWDALIAPAEKRRFVSYAADVSPENRLLHPDLSLARGRPYEPVRAARSENQVAPLDYAEWARIQEAGRAGVSTNIAFSLLTTLYIGTDADLFAKTAEAVFAQRGARFEWIILAHGPISPKLRAKLAGLASDARVKISYLEANLGIIGGMRWVLERATSEYVVPLDGDDLLTADALAILGAAIEAQAERPGLVYTDEDIIIGDARQAPYLRPGWDPVLDLENSWIWHACTFRRDLAMTLGVYADAASEYCHDWDTAYRFSRAGYRPLHAPQVAYHWRHHASSTSNSGDTNSGSTNSVRALLETKIADRGLADRYEVSSFPLFRGAEEFWIRPKAKAAAKVHTVQLGVGNLARLRAAVDAAGAEDLILLRSADVASIGDNAAAEAAKMFAFHPEVAVVSGRLAYGGVITLAGWSADPSGRLFAPYDNRSLSDAGPFVLGWKPQQITVGLADLCFVRPALLRSVLETSPNDLDNGLLAFALAAAAAKAGQRVAYSPLVQGESAGAPVSIADAKSAQVVWSRLSGGGVKGEVAGAASYGLRRFI